MSSHRGDHRSDVPFTSIDGILPFAIQLLLLFRPSGLHVFLVEWSFSSRGSTPQGKEVLLEKCPASG